VQQLIELGGKEFALQLFVDFEEEAGPLIEEAKKEVQSHQYDNILSTLHQMKGTGFTLGLNPLAEVVKKMEHDIKQKNVSNVDQDFELLEDHFTFYKQNYREKFI
jgi:HPt (histidine-containing phosphotransfer) domain-containing protein